MYSISKLTLSRGTYETKRKSSDAVTKWRHEIPFDLAKSIQNTTECRAIMQELGYVPLLSLDTLNHAVLLAGSDTMAGQWINQYMLLEPS